MSLLSVSLCAVGLSVAALNSFAGPAHRADIPAEPAWVLHMDVDAIRPSMVGQFLMEELSKPAAENKLAAFQATFSFDPRTALHGISLYSTTQRAEDGVLIVYADFDAERLVTLAKAAKDHQSAKHRSYVIHNWIDDKRKSKAGEVQRTYAAIAGKRVVFGQQQASVAAALDVIDGATGNLGKSKNFPELGSASEGKFIQGAGRKIQPPGSNPNGALLKLSDEIRLELGESNGSVNGLLTLKARDQEVAGHLNSIAQGLVALMKLQTEKPAQVRFAESVQLRQEGNEVLATMSLPAGEVIQGMKAAARKKLAAQQQ